MKQQQGFALLEVAVSVFVLAVGLLGLASLQLISLQNMNLAQTASLANVHLEQVAESMRNNSPSAAEFIVSGEITKVSAIPCTQNCSPQESAQAALARIKNSILESYNKPDLTIAEADFMSYDIVETVAGVNGAAPTTETTTKQVKIYTISLSWVEDGNFILRDSTDTNSTQTLKVVL